MTAESKHSQRDHSVAHLDITEDVFKIGSFGIWGHVRSSNDGYQHFGGIYCPIVRVISTLQNQTVRRHIQGDPLSFRETSVFVVYKPSFYCAITSGKDWSTLCNLLCVVMIIMQIRYIHNLIHKINVSQLYMRRHFKLIKTGVQSNVSKYKICRVLGSWNRKPSFS
jgi:hypothetical protein